MPLNIKLGPAGNCITAKEKNTVGSFKRLAELNLQSQEIEFVRGVYMNNQNAKEVGQAAKKLGIELSVHAPYYINLCNPEKLNDSEIRILDSCERAFYMGAYIVVFHPGYYGSLSKDEAFDCVFSACNEMIEKLKKKKIENVFLGLETTGKKNQFGTLEEITKICKKLKQCKPVIDFSHIYARQDGRINYDEVFDSVKILNLNHLHTHFSGIEFTTSGERRHLPIKNAKPDFKELANEILKRKLDITIICESPLLEQDSLVMRQVFKDLLSC